MFDYLKKIYAKYFGRKIKVYHCDGYELYNIQDLRYEDPEIPQIAEIFDSIKKNLKANGITLYVDLDTFKRFIDEILLTDDLDIFLEELYLFAYEYPDEIYSILPGDENFTIVTLGLSHEN